MRCQLNYTCPLNSSRHLTPPRLISFCHLTPSTGMRARISTSRSSPIWCQHFSCRCLTIQYRLKCYAVSVNDLSRGFMLCMDGNIDVKIDTCINVCVHMHADMCVAMCLDTCLDICSDMFVKMCVDVCACRGVVDMCVEMCRGICT